jgi:hypothetical protein
MDDRVYYGATVLTYFGCVALAIWLENLLILFDYLSALTVSGIQFLIPGLAYLVLSRQHGLRISPKLTYLSYLYIVLSVLVLVSIFHTL